MQRKINRADMVEALKQLAKGLKEVNEHARHNKTTRLEMAEAMKQLATQSKAQTGHLKAMEEAGFQNNKITKLQSALALARGGESSSDFKDDPDHSTCSSDFVCNVLRAFMKDCGRFIPE